MADQINYELIGDDFQAVVITLDPDEAVRASPGGMMWMEGDVKLDASTGGGLISGLKRKMSGESFFISGFENVGSGLAKVAFAAEYPGKILPLDLTRGDVMCQRDSYLCSAYGVDVSVAFTRRLGVGFFGGEGFILQKLSGDGLAFIHAGGHIIERELGAGEKIRVDTGCVVGFEAQVDYDIERVKGIKTMLFGGEGLFVATLEGPGKIWLQTTPLSRFANRILSASMAARSGS